MKRRTRPARKVAGGRRARYCSGICRSAAWEQGVNKPSVVVVGSALLWGLLWIWPFGAFLVGLLVIVVLGGTVLYGAVRHRRRGWTSGLLFALLLLGLPVWLGALMKVYLNR